MSRLQIHLFGQFTVYRDHTPLDGLEGRKVQELFCYLLLHRQQAHARETLAGTLWGDTSTAQSKSYLRKALWQLQSALNTPTDSLANTLLLVDAEEIQIDPRAEICLDIACFEQAFEYVRGVPGEHLQSSAGQVLRDAVELYRGDLLPGWYHDWCLFERERLQNMYLAMLDKLMAFCEVQAAYEQGLAYGERMLRHDRARELTHQRMMRLYYLAGDRTAALRQYERCVVALQEELNVEPTARTTMLYHQLRTNQLDPFLLPVTPSPVSPNGSTPSLHDLLNQLQEFQATLAVLHQQVQQSIQAVERALR